MKDGYLEEAMRDPRFWGTQILDDRGSLMDNGILIRGVEEG